jgi:hypothetical protein
MEYPKDVKEDFETLKGGGMMDGIKLSPNLIIGGLTSMGLEAGLLWAKGNLGQVMVLWGLTKV